MYSQKYNAAWDHKPPARAPTPEQITIGLLATLTGPETMRVNVLLEND
jgi:hypothetical protein